MPCRTCDPLTISLCHSGRHGTSSCVQRQRRKPSRKLRPRRKNVGLMLRLMLTSPSRFAQQSNPIYFGCGKNTSFWRTSSISFVIPFVSCHFCSRNFHLPRTSPPTAVRKTQTAFLSCLFVHSSLTVANFTVGPHSVFPPCGALTCRFHYYSGV